MTTGSRERQPDKPAGPHSGGEPLAAETDLASRWLGGSVIAASDESFGDKEDLLNPEPAAFAPGQYGNRGEIVDGWETRRRREPGHDWSVLALGAFGKVEEIVVDTAHFKGNYPDRCSIQASARAHGTPAEIAAQAESWPVMLPEVKLSADTMHTFRDELAAMGPVRFVRLNIFPDGGISRLRLMGTLVR